MKTEILQREAPVLRDIAQAVPAKDIGSKKIRDVIERMRKALHTEEDGVAIAAPQIGESLRIFVVNGQVFGGEDSVFINPELTKISKKKRKMEEGCLSVRWLYGEVVRSEKVTLKAHDESGKIFQRGASGLLAQIFQHEVDHLNGILFIDKAKNIEDIPPSGQPKSNIKFVFFGSSQFSTYVLEELEKKGFLPSLVVNSAKEPLPAIKKLKEIGADVFIVASFGKILPKEVIELPKHGSLNVHPSLLPELRGPSPIQNIILGRGTPGVSIMKMDEKMDTGPLLIQAEVVVDPWPDHYETVEEKLGRVGGKLLAKILPNWVMGIKFGEGPNFIEEVPQNNKNATYTKLIKKEDGLLKLEDSPEVNLRKVFAYSTWPGAYIMFKKKSGEEVRVIIKDAKIEDGKLAPTRIIPTGKKEMDWKDFLRGNS